MAGNNRCNLVHFLFSISVSPQLQTAICERAIIIMASPKPDSEGPSPRDGVTKQNISPGSSPIEGPIVAQVPSANRQFLKSHINVFIRKRPTKMPATQPSEMMRQYLSGP